MQRMQAQAETAGAERCRGTLQPAASGSLLPRPLKQCHLLSSVLKLEGRDKAKRLQWRKPLRSAPTCAGIEITGK